MRKKSKFKKIMSEKLAIAVVGLIILNIILLIFILNPNASSYIATIRENLQKTASSKERNEIFEEINPSKGYELNIKFNDIGPKMLDLGVIDLDKFKSVYDTGNQSLTAEQLDILTKGSDEKMKITRENSYFLLNFFWAVGLANNSKILTQGDMSKYEDAGNFASTGGWSLSKDSAMNYYSKENLISLTEKQVDLVLKVSSNIYRPCCDNPTSFPDCNHGMALLGVLELMASQGATEIEMYEAAKYINSFWFPSTYYDLAKYFNKKQGKKFSDVDGKVILGKDYSSATGYMDTKKWMTENGLVEEVQEGGGSCGV